MSFLLEFETVNVFNSTINKIMIFKSAQDAYHYGLKIEPMIARGKINSIEKAIENTIVWESAKTFPRYRCKIHSMDTDILWGLYSSETNTPQYLIQNIYKNLKINDMLL
jgi:hypothetical protein